MDDELLPEIWPVFSAEAREQVQEIASGCLEMERGPVAPERIQSIRRAAHSLKGSAGTLGLEDIERIAHALEGSLEAADGGQALPRALLDAVLAAVAAVEAALASKDAGGACEVPRLDETLRALASAPSPGAGPRPHEEAAPASGPQAELAALEEHVKLLCSPRASAKGLAAGAARAAAAAAALVRGRDGEVAELCRGIEPLLRPAPRPGSDRAARVAAELADRLVALRRALGAAEPSAAEPAAAEPSAAEPAEAEPAPAAGAQPAPRPAQERSIRVSARSVDDLARHVEMFALAEDDAERRSHRIRDVEARAKEALLWLERTSALLRASGATEGLAPLAEGVQRLRTTVGGLAALGQEGARATNRNRLTVASARSELREVRMVPAAHLLEPLRRSVREVARRLGKEVELRTFGADVRLDRRLVDELHAPLLHLVRNAVDHGLEPPEARRAAGKAPTGLLEIRVEPHGSRIRVRVADDGRGLPLSRIREAAVRGGLLTAEAAEQLPDEEAARLIFRPGISTAEEVSAISGRGVGLDVVSDTAHRLRGTVDVSFTAGSGTRFVVDLPLTLAAVAGILFRLGSDVAAVPGEAVERILRLAPEDLGSAAGRTVAKVGDGVVPLVELARLLGMPGSAPRPSVPGRQAALLLRVGSQRLALSVDEVVGQRELEVSSLGAIAARVGHVSGAAIVEDGRVVALLNPAELFRRSQHAGVGERGPGRARILVADDALTTRLAVKNILEVAGYDVVPAGDGEEALELLRQSRCRLVVSDIQMPRMDGLELTRRIRADAQLASTPVVLVTSLGSKEDRDAGLEAGADGYVLKREVERGKLLELVRQLLPEPD